jgi:purine-nucleoside phosphorylase
MGSTRLDFESQIAEATDFIRGRWDRTPKFGIILGTGAGKLAEEIEIEATLDYGEIPGFPRSTALGHKGQLVCGRLGGASAVAMQGRFHLYEGYPVDIATLPIHVMHHLGVNTLFVSNASGGINPKFASGEIMLIESHVDFMFRTSRSMVGTVQNGRPLVRSDCYDHPMIADAIVCARQNDFPIHQGVYAAMLGPNYETRAEYRFLKKIGGDVAGMSTVPEVSVAAKYGMRVLGLSVITNVAKPDILEPTSGQEVIAAAVVAAPHLKAIVIDAIEKQGLL